MTKISEYRKLLLSLGQELANEELEKIKFLCRDLLTVHDLEHVNSTVDLFVFMEQRKLLDKENLRIMQEIFTQLNREDLVERLKKFQRNHKQSDQIRVPFSDCVTDAAQPSTSGNKPVDALSRILRHAANSELMFRDVNAEIYERLAFLLNPNSFKCWIHVAGRLGYTPGQIANFKLLPMQSTQLLLEDWAQRNDATVIKLYQILMELGRQDAAKELEPILAPGTPV